MAGMVTACNVTLEPSSMAALRMSLSFSIHDSFRSNYQVRHNRLVLEKFRNRRYHHDRETCVLIPLIKMSGLKAFS